jgi:hypothetical protein
MLRGTRCDSTCAPKTKCSISLPDPNTTDHRVYIAAANYVTMCTHGHASIYSPSVSLPPHTMCTNTTARALHCTRSIPFHLYGCDGTRRAPVTTTQHAADMMCTAEAPVTHSLRTDLTACPVRLNASHGPYGRLPLVLVEQYSCSYKAAGVNEHHRYMTCLLAWQHVTRVSTYTCILPTHG